MYDVVALGEALIDFTPSGKSADGMNLFEQNPGGAPANVLCALSRLGLRTAFIGKVGQDMHGAFLREVLREKGVETAGLVADPDVFTTLAFVALDAAGDRSFSFARKPGADTCLQPEEVNRELVESCKIFHFGSLSLTDEPARSATRAAIRLAREAGAILSYDPNYRAPLWPGREAAVEQMRSVLPAVDLLKISDEEVELLTGETEPEAAARRLFDQGIGCVVITLGKDGAFAATKDHQVRCPVRKGPVVDTTGAGDAFWGGFLYQVLQSGVSPSRLDGAQLQTCAAFANRVAGLCVQKRGAIPALPSLEEVLSTL